MSVDQAVLQTMQARVRAMAATLAESRARRQRRAKVLGLLDDWEPRTSAGRRETGGRPVAAPEAFFGAPEPRPAKPSGLRLDDPPRGKRAPVIAGSVGAPRPSAGMGGASGSPASKLAAGYQPAVLKVISYGHGVSRATAMGQYVQRDETALETHEGRLLATHEAVAAEMKDWARGFDKRRPSDDVATFRLSLSGEGGERLQTAIEAGFAGHRFAYRIEEYRDGTADAFVVATMAGQATVRGENGDGTVRERFHLSEARGQAERRFSGPTQSAITGRVADALGVSAEAVTVRPDGAASHGKAGVVYQLSRLASRGDAVAQDGSPVMTERQVRATAQAWDRSLNSYEPRDIMHMILSAKAGEDKDALVRAARNFLHQQFGDHKFAFALHDDKEQDGHMHVHAIVAVKGEGGQRIHPGPADLRAWREVYAEKAQAEGMKIVATSAAYRASSQSYGPRDKAIVDAADSPREGREARDRAYAEANPRLIDNARRRIETARANPLLIPATERQVRAANDSLWDWRVAAAELPDNPTASHMFDRLTQAQTYGQIIIGLRDYARRAAMADDATAAEMRENLRDINEAVAGAAAALGGASRTEFLRRSAETMEMLAIRTDVKAKEEQGQTSFTEDEVRQLAGPHADAIIAHARQIQAAEQREADRADQIRDRAVERQVRDGRSGSLDPASLEQSAADREMVRQAETIAARERIEARAAAEAARSLAENPSQRLNPNLVQGSRLEELNREQRRVYTARGIDITPADGEDVDKEKPQSM